MADRPKRTRKAPTPLYVPDPNTKFSDDFSSVDEEISEDQVSYDSEELESLESEEECDFDDELQVVHTSPSSSDVEEEDDVPRTQGGYAKDGFVVSDDDMSILSSDYSEDEDFDLSEISEESEEESYYDEDDDSEKQESGESECEKTENN